MLEDQNMINNSSNDIVSKFYSYHNGNSIKIGLNTCVI